MAYTALEEMRRKNQERFGADVGPFQPPFFQREDSPNDLKSAALRFLRVRCEELLFDPEAAEEKRIQGTRLKGVAVRDEDVLRAMDRDASPFSLPKYQNKDGSFSKNADWVLDEKLLPEGWTLAFDLTTPSCRLLNQPYDPGDAAGTQYYVIDGLILSPNVELRSVETLDAGFAYSDHNPVKIQIVLRES